MADLSDTRVAIMVANYFEEAELAEPMKALQAAGATVEVIAPKTNPVQAMSHDTEKTKTYPVDKKIDEVDFNDFDALIVPGGTVNADQLRIVPEALEGLRTVMNSGRPVAVICHGPWSLVSAGLAKGKRLTSFITLKDDMMNAGADWVDEEVVIDDNLITSRNPDDLPAFNKAIIEMIEKA